MPTEQEEKNSNIFTLSRFITSSSADLFLLSPYITNGRPRLRQSQHRLPAPHWCWSFTLEYSLTIGWVISMGRGQDRSGKMAVCCLSTVLLAVCDYGFPKGRYSHSSHRFQNCQSLGADGGLTLGEPKLRMWSWSIRQHAPVWCVRIGWGRRGLLYC